VSSAISSLKADITRKKREARVKPGDIPGLVREAQAGDTGAMHRLLFHFGPMVLSIAASHAAEADSRGSSMLDLFQIGIIAADQGIRSYNPDKGLALSTWLFPKIRTYIRRELESCSIVRAPPGTNPTILPFSTYSDGASDDMDAGDLASYLLGEAGAYTEALLGPDTSPDYAEIIQFLESSNTRDQAFRAWYLSTVHGIPVRDIARILGISKTTAARKVADWDKRLPDCD